MTNDHNDAVLQPISYCNLWPNKAVSKIGEMLSEINQANDILEAISSTGQSSAIKGGFAAEVWHKESFNLDAILKDKEVRAFTDKCINTPLSPNDQIHDIVIVKDGKQVFGAQLKYFKDGDATHKAFRSTKGGVHQYETSDSFIGPSDQIKDIKSSAEQARLKNLQNRPDVSKAAERVRDKTAAQLDVDGVQSKPLSKRDAENLGTNNSTGKELHEKMQNDYLDKATVQQSLRAAGSAAIIAAVTAGTINTFKCIQQVKSGEITATQAVQRILLETVVAAGDSALKAGLATASVATAARYLPELFNGSTFQNSLVTGSIAGATVCAIDLVQCILMVAAGKMTVAELETRTGKNIFQTGAAVVGSSVGASIGSLGGPIGTLVGSLVGGMITSLAMNIALDNHIEKTFQLTLTNTKQIVSNGVSAHESLLYLQRSQEFFVEFNKGLYLSERHFTQQVKTLKAQTIRLKDKINKL